MQNTENTRLVSPRSSSSSGLTGNQRNVLCTLAVLSVVAITYWVVDGWNKNVASTLFQTKVVEVDPFLRVNESQGFANPLLLTVLQFAFMALIFLTLWMVHTGGTTADLRMTAGQIQEKKRWVGLAGCHAFSTFWLQSLMMPTTMMSLGMYAASRAAEIPAAAVLRNQLLGAPLGKRTAAQAGLAFAGAWLVVYAYTMIGNCLCIYSGSGVPLAGAALYLVWAMLLTVPAAHAVLEEGAIKQAGYHPLAVLGLENLIALLLSLPVLLIAHLMGWEDVMGGLNSIVAMPQIRMLVLWLCVQMCVLGAARVAFTCLANSFWTVSLRALKAAFTWISEVAMLTLFASGVSLSMQHPHASLWGFFMLCGVFLVMAAAHVDAGKDELAGLPSPFVPRHASKNIV